MATPARSNHWWSVIAQEQIPIRYLQLDSWWYYKSTTDPDGQPGKEKKSNKLPAGEWNRYGGLLEYKAHTDLFPNGLDAFQKSIGLPLVTHNRWIDPASPYHQQYKISGIAAVDPKWWDHIADYMKSSGIVTYEQDWLDRIYTYSPAFSSNVETGEAFLDNMARACEEQGITIQYCMPYPCYFLQGSRYANLTTIRTSGDRFNTNHWNDFLYTSRLAASHGHLAVGGCLYEQRDRQCPALHAFRRTGRHRRRHRRGKQGQSSPGRPRRRSDCQTRRAHRAARLAVISPTRKKNRRR